MSDELFIISTDPFNAESPAPALAQPLTPTRNSYVRTNFGVPQLDAAHRITVGGAVEQPFDIDLNELARMPQRELTVTMECAGNDRTRMNPVPEGEPWRVGAMSTSQWSGVPLRDLLARARVRAAARELVIAGADSGLRGDADAPVTFARSMSLDDATAADTILALTMNGEPLTSEHGAPARIVVPGWYGMASVKWVTSIEAIDHAFTGYFQRARYVYDVDGRITPVTRMKVKSSIVSVESGERVRPGTLTVWGWAWSGDGAIERVEVTTSAGETIAARLDTPMSRHAWTRWEARLRLAPGRCTITSRATDASGATQPERAEWNRLGYGNNAVRSIEIVVE